MRTHLEHHKQIDRDRALLLLGGFKTAARIAVAINSEIMRSLELFQKEGIYEAFGYDRFAQFLDECEHSPMSKTQYYERKSLLDKEGDQMFNLYSELGISIRKRKLLGKGNVEIDGDNVIIHGSDGEDSIVNIDDTARLMEIVTAVIDSKVEQSIKIERLEKEKKADAEKIRDRDREIDRVRAAKVAEFAADAHMTARVELGLAFNKFTDIVSKLADVEKDQFRDAVLEDVAGWSAQLRTAYRLSSPQGGNPHGSKGVSPELSGSSFEEAFDNFLDGVDLDAAETNDGELAAKL